MYEMIKEIAERCVQSGMQFGFKVATVKSYSELLLDPGLILPVEPCLVLENIGGVKKKICVRLVFDVFRFFSHFAVHNHSPIDQLYLYFIIFFSISQAKKTKRIRSM